MKTHDTKPTKPSPNTKHAPRNKVRKARSDSPLNLLSDDRQAALIEFLKDHPLREAVQQLAAEGVQTTESALCGLDWAVPHCRRFRERRRRFGFRARPFCAYSCGYSSKPTTRATHSATNTCKTPCGYFCGYSLKKHGGVPPGHHSPSASHWLVPHNPQ